jgi:hypothetical protein
MCSFWHPVATATAFGDVPAYNEALAYCEHSAYAEDDTFAHTEGHDAEYWDGWSDEQGEEYAIASYLEAASWAADAALDYQAREYRPCALVLIHHRCSSSSLSLLFSPLLFSMLRAKAYEASAPRADRLDRGLEDYLSTRGPRAAPRPIAGPDPLSSSDPLSSAASLAALAPPSGQGTASFSALDPPVTDEAAAAESMGPPSQGPATRPAPRPLPMLTAVGQVLAFVVDDHHGDDVPGSNGRHDASSGGGSDSNGGSESESETAEG